MAQAENKVEYPSYLVDGFDKLTPFMRKMHNQQNQWIPADLAKDFDVNGNHESWVKMCKEAGDHCAKALAVWPSPDAFYGEKAPYKKTILKPEEEEDLTCECLVFEPINEKAEEKKLMFIYVHGGGMAFFDGKGVLEWQSANYASEGHIGVNVLFTNSVDECYPRGLNDVISAIKCLSRKYKDKVKGICIHGESGGANLIVAAMMKLKKEEPQKDYVDCVYIGCPFLYPINAIEGVETPKDIKADLEEFAQEHLPTLPRGFFLSYKGPDKDDVEFLQDKYAWPYFALCEDLQGFPPTYVMSNECDQLRGIGLRFYRQLIEAGVKAFHTVEAGTFHGSEQNDLLYGSMIRQRRVTFLNCTLAHKEEK